MTDSEKLDAVMAEVRAIRAEMAAMRQLHEMLLVARPTQKALAAKLGVHPCTLSRRRKRERIRRILDRANA
jgi:hypothetical protein